MIGLAARNAENGPGFRSVSEMIAARHPSEPVFCVAPARLKASVERFRTGFGGEVIYAVKVNPEPPVLQALYDAGIRHFDVASSQELHLVHGLFADAVCHFMAPVRMPAATEDALRMGVTHFAVDHSDELESLERLAPRPKEITVLMRISTPSTGSMFELSSKFGTTPDDAAALANRAVALGFRVGLTFHVGSQCMDPQAYRRALALVRGALAQIETPIETLDVGGGFPAPYPGLAVPTLDAFFEAIQSFAAQLDLPKTCSLVAEPGRALVADGLTLVTQVVHRRDRRLYLNDGTYGSLMEARLPGSAIHYPVTAYRARPSGIDTMTAASEEFVLYGPTCDAYDVLPRPYRLPGDIAAGDWIAFGMIGAYATAMRTRFNGFYADTFVTISE